MADYIDRKAAIAALREFAEECKDSTEAATAAAMAISVISRMPGPWVSVEDRLPPKRLGVAVIVRYDKRQRLHNCTFVSHAWLNSYGEWVGIPAGGTVSSWAPMPGEPEVAE